MLVPPAYLSQLSLFLQCIKQVFILGIYVNLCNHFIVDLKRHIFPKWTSNEVLQ